MNPTSEQQAVLDAFATGDDVVIVARAGAGKTSTLRLIAEAHPDKTFCYVAYNKAIATEAQQKMPANVTSKTAHAFAFAAVGRKYAKRLGNSQRVPLKEAVRFLGLHGSIKAGDRTLDAYAQARLVQEMVIKFCKSAEAEPSECHLPWIDGVEKQHRRSLAKHLLPYARKAWADVQRVEGTLRFTHDHYLKIYQLTNPVLDFDVVLFDEAQDANPVIDAVISSQTAQRVIVGDPAQAIYGWNGAIDAMKAFSAQEGVQTLYLTQSFRFGQDIADVANGWLARLRDGGKPVVGTPTIASRVAGLDSPLDEPRAILTRTNAGAIVAALDLQAAGRAVHLVGGAADLEGFASAARDLQTKGWTSHRDLSIFGSWGAVRDFANSDPDGTDLTMLVRLVDTYGAQAIIDVVRSSVPEDKADVVISTAHKSKGREWESVRIHSDFAPKKKKDGEAQGLSDEEIMLRYVAVTRAERVLDPGPLAEGTCVPSEGGVTTTA